MRPRARELVDKAHETCFIANSVAVAMTIEPTVHLAEVTVP